MIFTRSGDELHVGIGGQLWVVPEVVRESIVQPQLPDFVLRGVATVGPTGWQFQVTELVGLCGSTPPPFVPKSRPPRRMGLDELVLFAIPCVTMQAVEGEPYVPSTPWVKPRIEPLKEVEEL